jgi:hypothetical protein
MAIFSSPEFLGRYKPHGHVGSGQATDFVSPTGNSEVRQQDSLID